MNKRGVCPGKEPKCVVSWLQSKGLLAACDVASLVADSAKPCCWNVCVWHHLGSWLSEAEVPICFLSARKGRCSWLQVKPHCSCWCFLLVHCCCVLCFPNELFKFEVKISQRPRMSLSSMDHSISWQNAEGLNSRNVGVSARVARMVGRREEFAWTRKTRSVVLWCFLSVFSLVMKKCWLLTRCLPEVWSESEIKLSQCQPCAQVLGPNKGTMFDHIVSRLGINCISKLAC